ncbi:hypothetical protein LQD23_21500 [Chromobacterium violaceum]|uniref:hypothetical protein n=1 Tax=Chromobacterium violaceum TaxID=536 RepID=UPI001E5D9625|nr:hypothetical protein [Chromobacterium violaceum]MCD0494854.1 hypothetical protein [Chromobacterium violaceum]
MGRKIKARRRRLQYRLKRQILDRVAPNIASQRKKQTALMGAVFSCRFWGKIWPAASSSCLARMAWNGRNLPMHFKALVIY